MSTFILKLAVSKVLEVEDRVFDRERFYSWVWESFGGDAGLLGIHEGTLLSQDAADRGFETDSWTVDSAEAPRERDWIESQESIEAEAYFDTRAHAYAAGQRLGQVGGVVVGDIHEQADEDWNANWRASFKGVEIPPFWRIVPPWEPDQPPVAAGHARERVFLKINPGAGFGTGTHETTQLCLQAIGELAARVKGARVLDFGSGSGILAIGAALLGAAVVDAVEIDPLAIDNSLENAAMNGVEDRVNHARALGSPDARYPLVIANILRPVLLEWAPKLTSRANGAVVLSGLIDSDLAEVSACYSKLLGREPEVRSLGEWRALVWK